jgi:cytochrome c553
MTRTTDTLKAVCVAFAIVALASVLFFPGRSSAAGVGKAVAAVDAGGDFKAKCAMCHGPDGAGNTPTGKNMKIKDLRSGEVQGMSDGDIYNAIANGKGKMQGYLKSLGADKCKQLAAYVKQLK